MEEWCREEEETWMILKRSDRRRWKVEEQMHDQGEDGERWMKQKKTEINYAADINPQPCINA